jgi:hypothetical protein
MANEKLTVKFPVEISKANNCVCSACHGLGRVVKLKLPETLYNKNGILQTRYTDYWICFNRREKLTGALIWGNEDGK